MAKAAYSLRTDGDGASRCRLFIPREVLMTVSRSHLFRSAAALAVALAATSVAVGAATADDDEEEFKARLSGYKEVPLALSTSGKGSLRLEWGEGDTSLHYKLRYSGLEGAVTMAHIHFGSKSQAGGVSVWLCGTTGATAGPAGTPTCPAPDGTVTGTITAAQVVGPAAQGIAAGELDELVAAIQAGATYGNVHTALHPGGEIRGQLED
jgi:hypothetical protein